MATMFPAEVETFTTQGEGDTYRFLQRAARPDADFFTWYSPDIEDREPDFILFSPDSGMIVLEVKDWLLEQIVEADQKSVLLRFYDKEERRKNPLAQAREYVNSLLSLLGKATPRMSNGKVHLHFPICCGAVFPHISRNEFLGSGLSKVIDPHHSLFWDEVQEHSPLAVDPSGQSFRRWLIERFPPLFPFTFSRQKLDWLRGLIFPVVRLDLPTRAGTPRSRTETIRALDHEQENLARSFGVGRRLVIGPSGSGKTLILAHQAWHLPRMNNRVKKVLLICFNLSLVGYIRRLLARKGVGIGPGETEVVPFYDLCERILGEHLVHSKENEDYYKLVVQETLERLENSHSLIGCWDAILVDEGQDFSLQMAQVLLLLLPSHGTLTVVQDENQTLYRNQNAGGWESMDIEGLRVYRLTRQYRNTRVIARMAASLLGEPSSVEQFAGEAGPKPQWLESTDAAAQVADVAQAVSKLVREGTPMSEIAVLYVSAKAGGVESLPEAIVHALESHGVLATWVARDEQSKRCFDITTDTVTVSTIHSVKGLDFANVFLLGLDGLKAEDAWAKRLAYVGMTRARESLTLAVCGAGGLARALKINNIGS